MRAVYKFYADCGRHGNLEGIFVAEKHLIDKMLRLKPTIEFGEVLGKHSDIRGQIEDDEIELLTEDSVIVDFFESNNISSGHNPLWCQVGEFDTCEDYLNSIIES